MAKVDKVYNYVAANGGEMVAVLGDTDMVITVISDGKDGRIVLEDGETFKTPSALIEYIAENYIAPEVDGSDGIGNATNTIFGGWNIYNHIFFDNGVSFGEVAGGDKATRKEKVIKVKYRKAGKAKVDTTKVANAQIQTYAAHMVNKYGITGNVKGLVLKVISDRQFDNYDAGKAFVDGVIANATR